MTEDTIGSVETGAPASSGLLGRDAFLAVRALPVKIVSVPELGGDVRVQGLSGTQRDEFEKASVEGRGKSMRVNLDNFRARLIVRCVVDEAGKRILRDSDVERVGALPAIAVQRIFKAAQELSGLADDEIEELTEELKTDPSDEPGSD